MVTWLGLGTCKPYCLPFGHTLYISSLVLEFSFNEYRLLCTTVTLFKFLSISKRYFQNISINFIILLSICKRHEKNYEHIIIVVNKSSKKKIYRIKFIRNKRDYIDFYQINITRKKLFYFYNFKSWYLICILFLITIMRTNKYLFQIFNNLIFKNKRLNRKREREFQTIFQNLR